MILSNQSSSREGRTVKQTPHKGPSTTCPQNHTITRGQGRGKQESEIGCCLQPWPLLYPRERLFPWSALPKPAPRSIPTGTHTWSSARATGQVVGATREAESTEGAHLPWAETSAGAPSPQSTSSLGRMISGPHPTSGPPEHRIDPKDPRVRLRGPRIRRVPKPGRSASFYLPKLDKVHRHSVTHALTCSYTCAGSPAWCSAAT